jgi:hypothetical protein
MIKVFRVPSGKRQYLPLYRHIQESGMWQVLSVSRHAMTDEWLIRVASKEWFLRQNVEQQNRIARGQHA